MGFYSANHRKYHFATSKLAASGVCLVNKSNRSIGNPEFEWCKENKEEIRNQLEDQKSHLEVGITEQHQNQELEKDNSK